MTVKTSISLTDQQAAFARKLVEEGRYSSISAVVQQGLEGLRQKDEARAEELALMREFFAERAKGPFLTAEEFSDRVDPMLKEKRAMHGLDD